MANVLLVEDEDQVRVLAELYLEEHGHTVLTAASTEGALAILTSDQPIDLLFTDLGLKQKSMAASIWQRAPLKCGRN